MSCTADGWSGTSALNALDRRVEIEEQGPLAVVADHALNPEERRQRRPCVIGRDAVQAG